ncbi:MAG: DUF2459 domain-containing protein [Cyclobacteriaceae bacterium]|nr:DUF2459 domain-containing protein [Cyclobacteriaceae bacterium]
MIKDYLSCKFNPVIYSILIKNTFKILLRILLALFFATIIYLFFAVILSFISVNSSFKEPEQGVTIYVSTNGVHTSFILPSQNSVIDWEDYFPPSHFPDSISIANHFIFGWGEKDFFINTPTWDDFKLSSGIKALFIPSESVLHITKLSHPPQTNENCIPITLTESQYEKLRNYILQSLATPSPLNVQGYSSRDAFYPYDQSYHLFKTCNDWVNRGLNKSGIRSCVWSPFDRGILYQLGRIEN